MKDFKSFGYVYAVLFSDGWVKVGRGRRPEDRIRAHVEISRMRGAVLAESVFSSYLEDSKEAERRLIGFCFATGIPMHGKEWFSNVDFERLSKIIKNEFSAADLHRAAEIKAIKSAEVRKIIAGVDKAFSKNTVADESSKEELKKWAASIAHAQTINKIYIEDGYGGDLFSESFPGISKFEHLCALAIHQMDCADVARSYIGAMENPNETLDSLVSAGLWAQRNLRIEA